MCLVECCDLATDFYQSFLEARPLCFRFPQLRLEVAFCLFQRGFVAYRRIQLGLKRLTLILVFVSKEKIVNMFNKLPVADLPLKAGFLLAKPTNAGFHAGNSVVRCFDLAV